MTWRKLMFAGLAAIALAVPAAPWGGAGAQQSQDYDRRPGWARDLTPFGWALLSGNLDHAERLARRELADEVSRGLSQERRVSFIQISYALQHLATAQLSRGKWRDAVKASKAAVDAAEAADGHYSQAGASEEDAWQSAAEKYASALLAAGDAAKAERVLLFVDKSLDQRRVGHGNLILGTANLESKTTLANHYLLTGDYTKALTYAEMYWQLAQRSYGGAELQGARMAHRMTLGLIYCGLGRLADARRELAATASILEQYPIDTLAGATRSTAMRAQCELATADYQQARLLGRRAVSADRILVRAAGLQQERPIGVLMDAEGPGELSLLHAEYRLRGGGPDKAPRAFDDAIFAAAQYARLTTTQIAVQRAAARRHAVEQGKGTIADDLAMRDSALAALDAEMVRLVGDWVHNASERWDLLGATHRRGERQRPAAEQAELERMFAAEKPIVEALKVLIPRRAEAERVRDAAAQRLATEVPGHADLLETRPVTIQDIAGRGRVPGLLRADEAMILITPGSESMPAGYRRGFVMVLVPGQPPQWSEIKMEPKALADAIALLRADLDSGGATRPPGTRGSRRFGARGFNRERAHTLYKALFGTSHIAEALNQKSKWIIVPQGSLLSLPFAALVAGDYAGGEAGDADPDSLRKTPWLGLRKTISILPTASSLKLLRGGASTQGAAGGGGQSFFGIGEPSLNGIGGTTLSPTNNEASVWRDGRADAVAILRLPAIEPPMLKSVADALGAPGDALLIGPSATEGNLRAQLTRLGRADIVMFNTHGLVASGDPGALAEPALVLMPPVSARGANDDGLLTAPEVAELRLDANWVILSACNTAAGDGTAEGLSGLTRGFFVAGARGLLVSQWRVHTDVAAWLIPRMILTTKGQGVSRAEALRVTMQALVDRPDRDGEGHSYAHPAAWAAFQFVGAD